MTLFGGVEVGDIAIGDFHGDLVQGAFGLGTVMAARGSAGIGKDLPDRNQATPALRTTTEAAIGIGGRTRTAGILAGKGAGEILIGQNAAGADDHLKNDLGVRPKAMTGFDLYACAPVVNGLAKQ